MKENKKTLTFLGAAIIAVCIATFTSPTKTGSLCKGQLNGASAL